MTSSYPAQIHVKVVGVGGAGGNAVARMVKSQLQGVKFLALNTDIQALRQFKGIPTFAIGPKTTGGMGSGGNPEAGRRAIKESQDQIARLLQGSDMVFVTAGMGGGTGTGAIPIVAEMAKKQGALTVGVVTLPFSFEGPHRMQAARNGLRQLERRVDTLITVENDRLLPSLKGKVTLDRAFQIGDEVLRQGVQGISDIIMVPGLINVDFADVKSVMGNGGPSFMAVGEGKGKWAAIEATHMALSNPLFDAPLEGASGILFNVRGGKDLTLGQVHEVAGIIRKASKSGANVIFGLVQERKLKKRVHITLVATGVGGQEDGPGLHSAANNGAASSTDGIGEPTRNHAANGHATPPAIGTGRLL